jgi:energy-coupling factor transporter transmembrane protein EcfT
MKSLAGMTGSILLRSLSRARQNHQALLARGYDSELLFLSPRHRWSLRNMIGAAGAGAVMILLSLAIRP